MSERWLMADRAELPAMTPEAEPVVIDVDEGRARLTLDDGQTLEFDAVELRSALGEAI